MALRAAAGRMAQCAISNNGEQAAALRLLSTVAAHQSRAATLLTERYQAMLRQGALLSDPTQERCVARLAQLADDLTAHGAATEAWRQACTDYDAAWQRSAPEIAAEEERRGAAETLPSRASHDQQSGGSFLSWVRTAFGGDPEPAEPRTSAARAAQVRSRVERRLGELLGPLPSPPRPPRGVYLHGSVGSGKTMMADLLFAAAAEAGAVPLRRRLHCNSALLELHSRMHAIERAASTPQRTASEGHRDQVVDKQKQSRQAKIAQRRLTRYRLGTSAEDFTKVLAASNSAIMLQAARALLRGQSVDSVASLQQASAQSIQAPLLPQSPAQRLLGDHAAALLCFDEFQTTDPYNVAALKALTEAALADGGVLVATSNRAPHELARHGLHEAMFGHFVETLHAGCDVVEVAAGKDYRRLALQTARAQQAKTQVVPGPGVGSSSFIYPLGLEAEAALAAAWAAIPAGEGQGGEDCAGHIPVMFGRSLAVPRRRGGAAWFDFSELCARPLGPADYLAVAGAFHTVFLSGVPRMSSRVRDQARRFITLVDELYNQRCRLVCSAAAPPDALFGASGAWEEALVDLEGLQFEGAVEGGRLRVDVGAEGGVAPVAASPSRVAALGGAEERFAFARAVSRLHEMQTAAYGGALELGRSGV